MENKFSIDHVRNMVDKINLNDFCPNCGHKLTKEDTEYFHTELCENCFEYCELKDRVPCCREPKYQKVRFPIAGGGVQIREQCANCGNMTSNAIGGVSKEEKQNLPMADVNRKESFLSRKSVIWREIKDNFNRRKNQSLIKEIEARKEKWFSQYNDYLQSPEWREKRLLVLQRDKEICQCCLKNKATQVHHKSYEFVDLRGSEPAFDLVSVCRDCHDKIESMKRQNRQANNG